jgi:hypothetical protein
MRLSLVSCIKICFLLGFRSHIADGVFQDSVTWLLCCIWLHYRRVCKRTSATNGDVYITWYPSDKKDVNMKYDLNLLPSLGCHLNCALFGCRYKDNPPQCLYLASTNNAPLSNKDKLPALVSVSGRLVPKVSVASSHM